MKVVRMQATEFDALAVTVTVEGGVEKYADALLRIFNNVRDAQELLSVENYAGSNDITVHCVPSAKEATIDFLEWFGKIKSCEKVLAYQLGEPRDYDFDEYDDAIVVPYFEN